MATYNYDLTVTDKAGTPVDAATVKIYDNAGNLDVNTTTDAAGAITTQTLDDAQDPYRIVIACDTTRPNYKTHDRKFYVGAAIADLVCLDWADGLEQTFTDYTSGSKTIKTHANPSGGSSTSRVWYWKKSTGAFRKLSAGSDLWDDDVAVGDCLVFLENSYGNTYFRNLWLNLSTGTDGVIKGVWEHHEWAGTTTSPHSNWDTHAQWYQNYGGLKDDTLGFTVTGGAGMYFNYETSVWNGSYQTWNPDSSYSKHGWRFRVTDVSGVTEGGVLAALPTYGLNHISAKGADITPADLYNASVARNWNNVFTSGGKYLIMAGLNVGYDAITTTMSFGSGDALTIGAPPYSSLGNPAYPLYINSEATLTMGTKQVDGTGTFGGLFLINTKSNMNTGFSNSGTFNCYGSIFYLSETSFNGTDMGAGEAIDSTFVNVGIYNSGLFPMTRCMISIGGVTNDSSFHHDPRASNIFTNCRFWKNQGKQIAAPGGNYYMTGVEKMNTAYNKFWGGYGSSSAANWYVRNPVVSNWSTWDNETRWGSNAGQATNIQFSFDLRVLDSTGTAISGATVAFADIYDTITNQTTDASGDITQQWITYFRATQPNQTGDYYANPMTVTISKAGYQTKTIKYTMSKKREEIEVLENRREV